MTGCTEKRQITHIDVGGIASKFLRDRDGGFDVLNELLPLTTGSPDDPEDHWLQEW